MIKTSGETNLVEWVKRIVARDADAESELVRRYQNGIAIIINRIVRSESVTEDLSQETFRIVLEKIRDGSVRDSERVSGFICSVARNLAIEHTRRMRRMVSIEDVADAGQINDSHPSPLNELLRKERAEMVREALNELKSERDREVILRFYIAEEDKTQICADLGLNSQQFNSVIFRALRRYRELYIKQFGEP
jgi:RNA polymerase sigma-70 factor (ECF subfamily)